MSESEAIAEITRRIAEMPAAAISRLGLVRNDVLSIILEVAADVDTSSKGWPVKYEYVVVEANNIDDYENKINAFSSGGYRLAEAGRNELRYRWAIMEREV